MRELPQHIQEKISEVFGLESFRAFSCRDDTGQITHHLDYMWVIVFRLPGFGQKPIITTGMAKRNVKERTVCAEATFFIKANLVEDDKFLIDDLKPIQLSEPDPVVDALQNMTILPISRTSIFGDTKIDFDLYAKTKIGESSYHFGGDAVDYKPLDRFVMVFWRFLEGLKQIYDDPRVNQIWDETDRNRRGGW